MHQPITPSLLSTFQFRPVICNFRIPISMLSHNGQFNTTPATPGILLVNAGACYDWSCQDN